MAARLKEMYKNEVAPQLMKKFNYKSVMEIPKLDKIVINITSGEIKDNSKILDSIIEFSDKIFTVETPDNPRALSSKALAEFVKNNYDVFVRSCNNISEAVSAAYENTDINGAIIACGSLSHLAIIEKEVERYNHG